jgi:hypothetical protein
MATQASQDYVQKMFIAYLGRAAAQGALTYYGDLIDADSELGKAQLFDDLYNSAEGQAIYGAMSTDQVIEQIFQNSFNRDPEFSGLTYYYNAIGDGTFNILEAAAVIANDAGAADAAILDAKKTAADKITTELGADAAAIADYTGNAAEARESMNKVTDAASATSYDAAAELAAIATGNQIGSTTALTTGADTVLGTADNDTITGTNTTYTADDLILDTTTTDNDTLTISTTADITATPTVSGIENINIVMDSFDGGGDNEIDLDAAGITGGTITGSITTLGTTVTKLGVTNASTGTTIVGGTGITGNITVTGDDNAALTINGAADITATATAGALTNVTATSSNATAATVSAADADGTVDATTTAGNLTVTAAAATTVDADYCCRY